MFSFLAETVFRLPLYTNPVMNVNIADVDTPEDMEKFTNRIQGVIKDKLVTRVGWGSAVLAVSGAISFLSIRLFKRMTTNLLAYKPLVIYGTSVLMVSIVTVSIITIMTIAKGILTLWKGRYGKEYALNIATKVKEHYDRNHNFYFAFILNLEEVDINNRQELSWPAVQGTRDSPLLTDVQDHFLDGRKGDLRKGVIKAIKLHGLASQEAYEIRKAISNNDTELNALKSEIDQEFANRHNKGKKADE